MAFLRAICEAAGLSAHVYTSPHLVRFAERIAVRGGLLDDDALTALLEDCEAANAGETITFFEITTAAAFLAFARAPADVTLLEVGLGGRFDATNVVDRPAVTVITPVSIDHQRFLGETLETIAFEKAGILKPGVPAVIGPQEPSPLGVIEARAREVGAPLIVWGRDFTAERTADGMVYTERDIRLALPRPGLAGPHQVQNAATAVAAARALSLPSIGETALAQGVRSATWPARLQRLTDGKLAERLPPGWELWLDGGHNPHAAAMLARHAAEEWSDRPLYAIFGAMAERDHRKFLGCLTGRIALLRTVTIPGEENAASGETLAENARSVGLEARPAATIAAALDDLAAAGGSSPARVLICGSLYLAGAVLANDVGP